MFIKYQFSNGESNDVEVSEELGKVMMGMDKDERNAERKETRRHTSLASMDYEGTLFKDGTDIEAAILKREDINAIRHAISRLTPQQQMMLFSIFSDGVSVSNYAVKEGIDHSAVSHRLMTIFSKLKRII